MTNKDIHKWSDGRYTLMFDEHTFFVWDNEKDERMCALEVTEKLNEQQATIQELERKLKKYAKIGEEQLKQIIELQEENEQLKYDNEALKGVFESYLSISEHTQKELREENEQLRQMIKENVFQQYNEGSLADLKFKAIAYDDIIKVKLSDESEPKVMVYCNYGKRENIMSFCQMFIPFGVAYEIKEVNDEG